MDKSFDTFENLNRKYVEEENWLEEKLQKITHQETKIEKECQQLIDVTSIFSQEGPFIFKTLDEMKQRNAQFIKEIEISKARLRSRSLYSPLETILRAARNDFIKSLSNN